MTPEDLEKIRQFFASQRSSGQLRGGDFDTSPRMTIATPEAEQAEYLRQSRLGETPIVEGPPEYDGFVDSGTGERGYMGFKYMPAPMDAPVNTAYIPPAPVNTAYIPPAPVNTAYIPPPQATPVNTAYMPPAPANTTYKVPFRRSPSSTSTGFNSQPLPVATTPSYGSPLQAAPAYGVSNATTTPSYGSPLQAAPAYGTSNASIYGERSSYSPKQAGKYNVDGTRLRNTGGLFNDLNAFFGRPQT